MSQLVDQLERLPLERETSTPEESVELQEERLQLERAKSAVRPPPARIIWPSTTHEGHIEANALLGASVATMPEPGAWISGLANPSAVTPRLDHAGRLCRR